MLKSETHFFCGTSNIVLPVPNKDHFPPEYKDKSRLNYYASLFNSIEVNSSFYKIPLPRTVEKWANDVPENFRFTFKFFGGITHAKELNYDPAEIQRFFQSINAAGTRKGCLLIQFPASISSYYFPKLAILLDQIHCGNMAQGWKLALEFRDSSWYEDKTFELLEKHSAAVVRHDMPKSKSPLTDTLTDFSYLRFHGEKGDYRGTYSDEFLKENAAYIRERTAEGKEVYVYFNNTMGEAVHNALDLRQFYLHE
ncbi:MAG: DUF72 domain-containing protein [Bacteroidia bacterium]